MVISKVVVIFLLFFLGYVFKRTGFFSPETASQLKKLVANITLPALLLRAFMSMKPGGKELRLALMMFGICSLLLLISMVTLRLLGKRNDIRSFMVSGFEAGMLGYALFLSVFGDAALPIFASVDLGQVLFVFIVLMPLLIGRAGTEGSAFRAALGNVAASPVVWSIVGGLLIGILARTLNLPSRPFAPIGEFLETLGHLTMPMIALAIGYELNFRRELMGRALLFVFIRKSVLIATALILVGFLPVKDRLTAMAFMTMLLLPPPFVVTLAAKGKEQALVSGILSVSTLFSIPAFAAVVLIMGAV